MNSSRGFSAEFRQIIRVFHIDQAIPSDFNFSTSHDYEISTVDIGETGFERRFTDLLREASDEFAFRESRLRE